MFSHYLSSKGIFQIVLRSLESGERKVLFKGDIAHYLPTGHLVYPLGNNLMAVPFDINKLEVTGGPVPVIEDVFRLGPLMAPQYAISDSGTLVYVPGTMRTAGIDQRTLVWVDREGKDERLSASPNSYQCPRISPDGRWMVYTSNESGQNEIYVRQFPNVEGGGRWQISTDGGDSALWLPDGREMFYRNGDTVMAVAVRTEPTFNAETPKSLFRGAYVSPNLTMGSTQINPWDISPDGKRFLMLKEAQHTEEIPAAEARRKINIVSNWFEELKQRAPVR
jgi:dipeptidyl aminopeptidase/acylaminoacyl peptidase